VLSSTGVPSVLVRVTVTPAIAVSVACLIPSLLVSTYSNPEIVAGLVSSPKLLLAETSPAETTIAVILSF
jgi:hypothetical protein